MSDIDPKKMKVADLREELKSRGLDSKGNKNQLVKRLEKALAEEAGADPVNESTQEESILETTTEDIEEESAAPDPVSTEPEVKAEPEPEPEPEPEQEENKGETKEEPSDPVKEEESQETLETEADPVDKKEVKADDGAAEQEETSDVKEEGGDGDAGLGDDDLDEGIPIDGEFQVMDSVGDTEGMETEEERRGEKRRRSRSRDRDRDRYGRHHDEPKIQEEKDDWLQATNFQLDRFNSDLNLRIRDEGHKANPITVEGFAFMWAGARSNFGVTKGKVAFEVKVLDHLNVDHLPPEETHLHVVRVGWSLDKTSFQLGEEPFSYGYGGTAKKCTDCKFEDYGSKFANGDVIGVYLDLESEPAEISFTKNGEDLGKCFEIEKETLEEQAVFPHIMSKNCEYEVNFGEKEEPFFPLKEDYSWINNVAEEDRVRGMLPNSKKEECEIIMMCGLPGAGKTVWATKHAEENKEKRFNVLGTNNIIDKMKVMGLPRKKNYAGRWDVLIDKSTRCLNRLMEIASQKKRNYILDQTNVYPSAQRRKMRPFEGFQRKAIVIVPTDEEYKKRCEKREKEEGKEVPDSAVLEMKANFALPEEGSVFDKVEFVELEREEASKLVEKYNKEGRDNLPPPDKRYRDNRYGVPTVVGRDYGRDRNYRGGNRGYHGGGGYDRRGGGYGGNRGGYDRRGSGDRGRYMGYSQSDRRRYDDRNDRRNSGGRSSNYDRNRNSSGGWNKSGGWNNQGSWGNQGGWGNQGWGNQGSWGNQNYQGGWGGQWGNYQGQGQGSNQGWGQNYSYNNWNQGSWSGYNNQNQGQGSWGSYGSGSYHK